MDLLKELSEYVWVIRKVEVFVHTVAGSVAIAAFILAGIWRKGSLRHIRAGRIYGISLLGLFFTSLVAFLIHWNFPSFLMAFMACYLYYSSTVRKFGQTARFDWFMLILAVPVAVFYMLIGDYLRDIEGNDRSYPYFYWGFGFLLFVLWDLIRTFGKKDGPSARNWAFAHLSRNAGSFYFVITAFMVSQFSDLEPGTVILLCWYLPIVLTGLIFMAFYFNYHRLYRKSWVTK